MSSSLVFSGRDASRSYLHPDETSSRLLRPRPAHATHHREPSGRLSAHLTPAPLTSNLRGPIISDEKQRLRAIYGKDAPRYDRSMACWERVLLGGNREWVCARATGDVLEIAIGTGLNLPHYPAGSRLTGIELSAEMLELARTRAADLGLEIDLRQGDAEALDFPDASFDTVVCTYALCTIPEDRRAVREAARVLRPGGQLVLAEHVRSPRRLIRAVQRLLEPLTLRLGGDHLLRDPLDHLHAEGLGVEEVIRSRLGIVERLTVRKPKGQST